MEIEKMGHIKTIIVLVIEGPKVWWRKGQINTSTKQLEVLLWNFAELLISLVEYYQCDLKSNILGMESCDIGLNESLFQLRYYVLFRINTLGKGMDPFIPLSYWLNDTTAILLHGWLWY